ncbi:MAG: hypothetical protein WAV27_06435 [Xanthobacteraceae bacterium]
MEHQAIEAAIDSCVGRANIRHFGDRLRSEADPTMRYRVQKLLIAEEDKRGQDLELIVEVERTLSALDTSIQTQAFVVNAFNGGEGNGFVKAKSFLSGLVETHSSFKDWSGGAGSECQIRSTNARVFAAVSCVP